MATEAPAQVEPEVAPCRGPESPTAGPWTERAAAAGSTPPPGPPASPGGGPGRGSPGDGWAARRDPKPKSGVFYEAGLYIMPS